MAKMCIGDGCERKSVARGMCFKHYHRVQRSGKLEIEPIETRLQWLRKAIEQETDECILWPWGTLPNGYGVVSPGRGSCQTAHHIAKVIADGGKDRPGRKVGHTCGNRLCLNPRHLFWGHAYRGSRHHLTKLTEADVEKMLQDRRPVRVIAEEYGMTRSAVYAILAGTNWKHVKAP